MAANRQRSTLNGTGIWRALASISVMALAFALPGCQGPVTGIFHHLAHQQPTVDRNLANDITIGGVARWDDRYVVAAGKLWSRPVGTTDKPGEWVPVTATYDGEQENAVLLPLVRWQPDRGDPMLLAGALFIDDDESFALLQADGNQVQANSIAWRTVGGDEVAGREVIGMFTPDEDESVLFVVVHYARGAERPYRLLSATGRSSGAPDFTVELPELSHPVEAVATDGAGTYWAVAGSELYTGTRGGLLLSDTAPSPEGSETFRGVVHGGTDTLLLTGSVGTVWRSRDGGRTWPDRHEIRVEDQAVRLAAVAAVSGTGLIGTDGYGYYTASFDGELAVERLPLTTEAIYQASILGFWVGPETADGSRTIRTLFVLTAGDGLWAATVATGELPDRWQLE
jgi:hypothetical protein